MGANDLRPGPTLVIMSSEPTPAGAQHSATSMAVAVAPGKVAPCEPVKAPASEGTIPDAGAPRRRRRLDEGGTTTGRDRAGTTSVEE